MWNFVQIKTLSQYFSAQIRLFCHFSFLISLTQHLIGEKPVTLLHLLQLDCRIKPITFFIIKNVKRMFCILSTKLFKFLIYLNYQLPNLCIRMITVDCLNALTITFVRLHESTIIN